MTYTHKTGVYALYLAALVLAAVLYFAFDGTDLCGNAPASRYVVNLVCIAVTAAAVFVVVSWEKLGFVARPCAVQCVWRILCVRALLRWRSTSTCWPIVWLPTLKIPNTVYSFRSCWESWHSPSSTNTMNSD